MFYDDEIKEKKDDGDNTPAWMLTFADLVSLLICFFVLLYSMKSVDEEIWNNISGSFAGALSSSQKFKKMNPNNNSGVDVERILSSDSMEYVESVIRAKFEKEGLLDYAEIFQTKNNSNLHMRIPAEHLFKEKTFAFSEKGTKILTLIASCILYIKAEIEVGSFIESDTDESTDMKNSLLRSLNVRRFFKSQGLQQPVKVVGFGSELYEQMKDIYSEQDLKDRTVKLDIVIKGRVY